MKISSIHAAILSSAMIFGFTQCSQQAEPQQQAPVAVSGLKMAYIDVDSLLANYAFYQDLSEELMRKEENYRLVLTEEANKFQKEVADFEKKVQAGVYSSEERARQEQTRLTKKQQSLTEKGDKYQQELEAASLNNSQKISETIDNFIKEYNKSHGYNIIVAKSALMYADENLNITAEILDGLNAAYKPSSK